MIRVVLFDLDDTLYPEIEFVSSGFKAVSDMFQTPQFPAEVVIQLLWKFYRDDHRNVLDRLAATIWGATADDWTALGLNTVSELSREMIRCYREHAPQIKLFPDAQEVLTELKRRRIRMGLITDGLAHVQKSKVNALQLNGFDLVIYTDLLAPNRAAWKPSIQPFLIALKHFAEPPGAMCYVGDNPEKDFAGPMELGMKTVWVKRENGVHAAKYVSDAAMESVKVDYTVQALNELLRILEID